MKNKIYFVTLGILVILFTFVIVLVCFNKHSRYDNEKLNLISSYLLLDSNIYGEWYDNIKTKRVVTEFDDFDINKIVLSYLINNEKYVDGYDYDRCNECYNYFSKFDNIKFFNPDDVEGVSNLIIGKNMSKITQKDMVSYNILYYNSDINMYYVNYVNFNEKSSSFVKLKEYKEVDDYLYFDYYYFDAIDLDDYDNIEIENDSKFVSLMDINGRVIVEDIEYNFLIDSGFDIKYKYDDISFIRYIFKFDKMINKYILNEVKVVEE